MSDERIKIISFTNVILPSDTRLIKLYATFIDCAVYTLMLLQFSLSLSLSLTLSGEARASIRQ